jgi:LysM repeat protein
MARWERYIVYPLFIAALFLGVGNIGSVLEGAIAAQPLTYTVKKGDTLSELAKAWGWDNYTTVETLQAANDISDPDLILVGQELLLPPGTLDYEQRYEEYVVRIYHKNIILGGSIEILYRGSRVWGRTNYTYEIGTPDGYFRRPHPDKPLYVGGGILCRPPDERLAMGGDITGDGEPNLVIWVWEWRCGRYQIFEIADEFRPIQTIDVGSANRSRFWNMDEDEALEFITWDLSLSPAPEVILKYQDGEYAIACELMRKPKLTDEELAQLAAEIKQSPEWEELPGYSGKWPKILLKEMLDLIYAGNMAQAWTLLDLAWPDDFSGKEEFTNSFQEQLTNSHYWEEIKLMNE